MRFANPWYLLWLIVWAGVGFAMMRYRWSLSGSFLFPSIKMVNFSLMSWKIKLYQNLKWVRWLTLFLLILALARPQRGGGLELLYSEGIDIVLTMDASGSMRAEDFKPNNRFFVAKEQAKKFVQGRQGDRVGLVVFGEQAVTICPLTHDIDLLNKQLNDLQIGIVPEEKTAIGTGISIALNRLRKVSAKSKVIILLTDGDSNAGKITPITAAQFAKKMGVKIYTIAVGQDGQVPITVQDPMFGPRTVMMQTNINEKLLGDIAQMTGGLYFRATTPNALENIYKKIDTMEKTQHEFNRHVEYYEMYTWLLGLALISIVFDLVCRLTILKIVPERSL